jgi:hypothetical protein
MCWYLKTRCINEGASEWLVGRRVTRSSGAGKHTRRGADHLGGGYLVDATTEMDLDHKEKWYLSLHARNAKGVEHGRRQEINFRAGEFSEQESLKGF